jgi:hypothetical protein
MLVTMIIIGALLAGGAVLVNLQMSSNKSMDLTRTGMTALYCAEAGLSAARPLVATNFANWAGNIGTGVEPSWLNDPAVEHDLDGDGDDDIILTLKDNADEGTAADDPTIDTDLQVFIVSKCIAFPETEKEVSELVLFNGAAPCYPGQQGGCNGDGH